MNKITCSICGRHVARSESIYVLDAGPRCFPCHNREMAAQLGVRFDHTPLEPIVVNDAEGAPHTFAIRSLLVPTGREMMAVETTAEGVGYQFKVLGASDADAWDLFMHLYEKIRREMAVKYLERSEHRLQLTEDHRFVARIERDPDTDGYLPQLVIDGRACKWEDVGHMLMTYEGFTLRAQIEDGIDIVGGPLLEEGRKK